MFKKAGYSIFKNSEIKKNPHILDNINRYVVKNVPFKTIYNSNGRTEFLICKIDNESKRYIRVEAKHQSKPGSVDEKFPYMLLNGIYQYPENEVVFVIDGGGYKPGARKWVQDQIDNDWLEYKERGKDIKLMDINEFLDFFRTELA